MTLIPLQVTFHGLAHSAAIEADIQERVTWLEQFYGGIVSCRVRVEVPHRHRHDGRHFDIRIELTVAGGPPIVVSHEPSVHGPMKDAEESAHRKASEVSGARRSPHVAIHEAFDVARRRLQDFAREHRGSVKTHETPAHGVVTTISLEEGYGFIQAEDRQIFFARASVLDDNFGDLVVGSRVAFVEEQGDKGPQASTVRLLGKHHYVTR